jgi:hypothetical protein
MPRLWSSSMGRRGAGGGPEGVEERRRVVTALVEEGTAVLALDPHPPRGRAADTAGAPRPRELVPELLGALHALRRDAGAMLPARERWPTHAPLLCAAVAVAVAPRPAETAQDCVAALLSPAAEPPEVAALTSGRRGP